MGSFKVKMHQNRFRPGLCPGPRWRSLQRSPRGTPHPSPPWHLRSLDLISGLGWSESWQPYVQLLMEPHLRATGCHLSYRYGITVLHTIRHKWTHAALTPTRQAGTRFAFLGGMEGWVDLVDWLHTGLPAHRRSPIRSGIEQRYWRRPMP